MSIRNEKKTVRVMVGLYCRAHHGSSAICDECAQLLEYAERRLERCPFGDGKPTCRHCAIHCYAPSMREQITAVMRYAGPRMLLRHPILGLRHLAKELASAKKTPGKPIKRCKVDQPHDCDRS